MSMLIATLLVGAQAPAAAPVAPPAVPAATAPKKAEKKICRTEEAESGSHMGKRTCHTAYEWQLVDQGINLGAKSTSTSLSQDPQ